ncbi:MAG: SHOCT domain-containing protein [Desulfovibrio sp.]|nr:SHOCT domain-containing protein [Desulfovibrio sp.]
MSYLNISAQAEVASKWRIWPFNAGTGGDWETSLATYAFSFAILAVICLFLRFLYGPKGIWRDHEMDREADEMRRREHARLDADYHAGRIPKQLYELKKRSIDR